jgi:naphthalene 1,2-dioxygenase system ferredoxin subunit
MSAAGETRLLVARFEDVADGDVIAVTAGDRQLALYRVGSSLYATDNRCTHGAARLCDGFLDGYAIECPLHQGTFDIRTGAVQRPPAEVPLRTYRVEVEGGNVYVMLG